MFNGNDKRQTAGMSFMCGPANQLLEHLLWEAIFFRCRFMASIYGIGLLTWFYFGFTLTLVWQTDTAKHRKKIRMFNVYAQVGNISR